MRIIFDLLCFRCLKKISIYIKDGGGGRGLFSRGGGEGVRSRKGLQKSGGGGEKL